MIGYHGVLHGSVGENSADIESLSFAAKQSMNVGQWFGCSYGFVIAMSTKRDYCLLSNSIDFT